MDIRSTSNASCPTSAIAQFVKQQRWQMLKVLEGLGKKANIMHISTACPGGTPPGQPGGNEGEFGILSVYSTREPRGNYKLRNNRTTGGGEVGDFDVTIWIL